MGPREVHGGIAGHLAIDVPATDEWPLGPRARPIIVPIRQNLHLVVESDKRALSAMLEVLPTNIAPQALVWIHLAGVQTRDVA